MKKTTTKTTGILLAAVTLLILMPFSAFSFSIDPQFKVDGKSASTLADAFNKADETGSVIIQDGKTSDFLTVKSGIEVTKDVTLALGKDDFNPNVNRISYTGENAPLFTIKNGGVLTIKYSTIYGNSNAVNTYGGLIRVEKGGTLILDGTADEPVVISDCKLTAQNSKGGVIYAEQGGKIIVNGVTFTNNSADEGADIYAESKDDVTIKSGVNVNIAYGEFHTPCIEPSPDSTTVIDYDKNIIYGIEQNLSSLDTYIKTSESGLTVSYDTAVIGTGTAVNVSENGEVIETYTAVLFGDVNGDGRYDGEDAVIVNCIVNGMLSKEQIGEAEYMAADCNHDDVTDENDVDMLIDAGLLLENIRQTTAK